MAPAPAVVGHGELTPDRRLLARRGGRRAACCLRAGVVVLFLFALPALTIFLLEANDFLRSHPFKRWSLWRSRQHVEPERNVTLTAILDADAIDLLAKNYFLNQRQQLVEDIQKNAFAQEGPVITAINAAVGERVTIDSLGLDITEPHFKLLGVSMKRRIHTPLIDLDVDLACWLNFMIDVEATGHLDVAPWRRFGNTTSQIYKGFVDASLRAFSYRDVGDYDYDLSAQVMGHVEGQFKVKLTLESTEEDAFPRAIHVAPEDVANLQLSLDDYSVNWLWIKRLQLVPIGLLERVVNLQLQNALREKRAGWPIVMTPASGGASSEPSIANASLVPHITSPVLAVPVPLVVEAPASKSTSPPQNSSLFTSFPSLALSADKSSSFLRFLQTNLLTSSDKAT